MRNNSCRAAERAARLAILDVANAENCSDEVRLRALGRLAAIINGHLVEIASRSPAPAKSHPLIYE
jgi:hypothetical protein